MVVVAVDICSKPILISTVNNKSLHFTMIGLFFSDYRPTIKNMDTNMVLEHIYNIDFLPVNLSFCWPLIRAQL